MSVSIIKLTASLIPLIIFTTACSTQAVNTKQSVSETIPLTVANIRGHEEMYKQGWFVVSSSEKALQYAKKHGAETSWQAIKKARLSIINRSQKIGGSLKSDVDSGIALGGKVFTKGSQNTQDIMEVTQAIATIEKNASKHFADKAYASFVTGYLTLEARTSADFESLNAIPGGYFENLKSDFRNLSMLSEQAREKLAPKIESSWSVAFEKGKDEFIDEYQNSGKTDNSLTALTHIIKGYWKALYYGVISPSAARVKSGGSQAGLGIAKAVALPTSALLVVSGRTVQSIGMTIWYSTSVGIKLVSPTVEGGLLGGLSILSAATIPITVIGGASAGLVNQVAVIAATPTSATATASVKMGFDAAKYGALMVYDIASATTRVSIETFSSGVVLGYNGITALPAQTILGVTSGVFFLAWDGPRLVIAYASGKIKEDGEEYDLGQLPIGTVVDLKKLRAEGIEVNIVTDDKDTISKVLESAPEDMQQGQ